MLENCLTIIGKCVQCGAPIYGPNFIRVEEEPNIKFSCGCWSIKVYRPLATNKEADWGLNSNKEQAYISGAFPEMVMEKACSPVVSGSGDYPPCDLVHGSTNLCDTANRYPFIVIPCGRVMTIEEREMIAKYNTKK